MPSVRADSPLPTPAGWALAGELRPGDIVFGADGGMTSIYEMHDEAVAEAYECRMVMDPVVVSADHDVMLGLPWYGQWIGPVAHMDERRRRLIHPLASTKRVVLELPDTDLALDPWTYGYWRVLALPDGVVAVPEPLAERAMMHMVSAGLPVTGVFRDRGLAYLSSPDLAAMLDKLGEWPAFHPDYMRAGAAQRRALLSGITDARGTFLNGVTVQAARPIIEAAAELAMSLGLRASIPRGPVARVRMSPHDAVMMLRCEELADFLHGPDRPGYRTEVPYMIRKAKRALGGDFKIILTETHTYLLGKAMLPVRDS